MYVFKIFKGSHFGANVLNIILRMKRSTSSSLIGAKHGLLWFSSLLVKELTFLIG